MFEFFLFGAFVILCLLIWIIFYSRRGTDYIPGPTVYPLVGTISDLIQMRRGITEYLQESREKFGPIYRLCLLNMNFFIISEPDYIKTLLSSSENLTRPFFTSIFERYTGKGLPSSTGALWHSQRKLLEPSFTISKIKSYIPSITEECENMCNDLVRFDGQEINMISVLRDITVKLAYDHFYNITLEKSKIKEIANDNGELTFLLLRRFLHPWLWSDFVFSLTTSASRTDVLIKKLHGISLEAISMKKKENNGKLDDKIQISFLDYLVEYQKEDSNLTDEDIRINLDNLVFGAMNGLPILISIVLYFVASNDAIQDKVRRELNSIFSQPFSSKRIPTMDQLSQLKYLESVINESIRLCEFPPILGRFISKDLVLGNYTIPAGSTKFVDWNAVHRNKKYYSTPNEFNPDHFYDPEEVKRRPFYSFLPFGKSWRVCIGEKYSRMVMKLIIASVVLNFQIESTQSLETLMKSQLRALVDPSIPSKSIFIRIKSRISN